MANIPAEVEKMRTEISEASAYIRNQTQVKPRVGVICGTGMGSLGDQVEDAVTISYEDIPHFPVSTVESHSGNFLFGTLGAQPVCLMQGRFHYYEGYSMKQVTLPVRVMRELGCEVLFVMNAVGSMNPFIRRGSLVFIDDHMNFIGDNPLLGPNDDELGPRFLDMSQPYTQKLIGLGEDVALKAGIPTKRGVLVGVAGPNLETRAEYRAFRLLGADIVGMSTIPEVLVANHGGMKVIGLSTVTDECYPDALEPADIGEIIAVAGAAEPKIKQIVTGFLSRLDEVM
ncbi:MAG: purine-nucleoside phosphorylase [Candidatus Sumerlaeota bacterium]